MIIAFNEHLLVGARAPGVFFVLKAALTPSNVHNTTVRQNSHTC